MFTSQQGNSGVGGLVGVAAVLAAWVAVATVMWGAYVTPQIHQQDRCQMVCRQVIAQLHPKS